MNFFTRLFSKKRKERDNRKHMTDDTAFLYSAAAISTASALEQDQPMHDIHHSGSSGTCDNNNDASGSYDSDSTDSSSFDGGGDSGGHGVANGGRQHWRRAGRR